MLGALDRAPRRATAPWRFLTRVSNGEAGEHRSSIPTALAARRMPRVPSREVLVRATRRSWWLTTPMRVARAARRRLTHEARRLAKLGAAYGRHYPRPTMSKGEESSTRGPSLAIARVASRVPVDASLALLDVFVIVGGLHRAPAPPLRSRGARGLLGDLRPLSRGRRGRAPRRQRVLAHVRAHVGAREHRRSAAAAAGRTDLVRGAAGRRHPARVPGPAVGRAPRTDGGVALHGRDPVPVAALRVPVTRRVGWPAGRGGRRRDRRRRGHPRDAPRPPPRHEPRGGGRRRPAHAWALAQRRARSWPGSTTLLGSCGTTTSTRCGS